MGDKVVRECWVWNDCDCFVKKFEVFVDFFVYWFFYVDYVVDELVLYL